MTNIVIIGASNPTIFGLIEDINETIKSKYLILGVLDNNHENLSDEVFGYQILGGFEKILQFSCDDVVLINAIAGSMKVRRETTNYFLEKNYRFTTLIHPSVKVRYSSIGVGSIIYQNAMLHPYTTIGEHCIISSLVGIAHEAEIENFCFVGPASYVCGKVYIKSGSYLGVGCRILPRITIGKNATIAACSMVNKDVADSQRVQGIPSREF